MAEVALEALVNARRLHDDAVSLRQGDRLPSALMVGGLGADELGKHVLVSSFFARDQTVEEWRKFWRSHLPSTECRGLEVRTRARAVTVAAGTIGA